MRPRRWISPKAQLPLFEDAGVWINFSASNSFCRPVVVRCSSAPLSKSPAKFHRNFSETPGATPYYSGETPG
jgi:hypothetical protein